MVGAIFDHEAGNPELPSRMKLVSPTCRFQGRRPDGIVRIAPDCGTLETLTELRGVIMGFL
jgi:hypothetical protein